MTFRLLPALATALALGACETTTGMQEASAVTPLLGERLVAENGTEFLFNADGTVGGEIDGAPIAGTYTAEGGEICSTYTAPPSLAGQEFCSVPSIEGDAVTFDRRDGSQSQSYVIGG